MNNILVVYKENLNEQNPKAIDKIELILKDKNYRIIGYNELKKEDLRGVELVITLGGDGTFVKAANLIEESLILGINVEPKSSEGALTSLDIDKITDLENLFSKKFRITKRQRAKIVLNGMELPEKAINEVYIGAASQFHSSRYKIIFNKIEEEHRSSGIIDSTGTGSAAWFFSAGGEIFNPEEERLSFIVREPYFGKKVFVPKLLRGDIKNGEKIRVQSTRDFGGILAINDSTYEFNSGDTVEIEISDKPLKVIKFD